MITSIIKNYILLIMFIISIAECQVIEYSRISNQIISFDLSVNSLKDKSDKKQYSSKSNLFKSEYYSLIGCSYSITSTSQNCNREYDTLRVALLSSEIQTQNAIVSTLLLKESKFSEQLNPYKPYESYSSKVYVKEKLYKDSIKYTNLPKVAYQTNSYYSTETPTPKYFYTIASLILTSISGGVALHLRGQEVNNPYDFIGSNNPNGTPSLLYQSGLQTQWDSWDNTRTAMNWTIGFAILTALAFTIEYNI